MKVDIIHKHVYVISYNRILLYPSKTWEINLVIHKYNAKYKVGTKNEIN